MSVRSVGLSPGPRTMLLPCVKARADRPAAAPCACASAWTRTPVRSAWKLSSIAMRTAGAMGWPPGAVVAVIGRLSAESEADPMRTAGANRRETAACVLVVRGSGTGIVTLGGGTSCGAGTNARAGLAMNYLLAGHGQRHRSAQGTHSPKFAVFPMHCRFQVQRFHGAGLFKGQH